jgi:hypothetical protein
MMHSGRVTVAIKTQTHYRNTELPDMRITAAAGVASIDAA